MLVLSCCLQASVVLALLYPASPDYWPHDFRWRKNSWTGTLFTISCSSLLKVNVFKNPLILHHSWWFFSGNLVLLILSLLSILLFPADSGNLNDLLFQGSYARCLLGNIQWPVWLIQHVSKVRRPLELWEEPWLGVSSLALRYVVFPWTCFHLPTAWVGLHGHSSPSSSESKAAILTLVSSNEDHFTYSVQAMARGLGVVTLNSEFLRESCSPSFW